MRRLVKAAGAFAVLAAAAVLSLASAGCKSSSSTTPSTLATIVVTNVCGATVIIYTDGVEKTTLDTATLATLSSVPPGNRLLESKNSDDWFVVYSQTLAITPSTVNYVTIRGGASVHVTNLSGQILRIYEGGSLIGDIGDQITLTISRVAFGSHTYQAQKPSDATVVSEFTIDVTDFSQFTWTITP